jgi:serine/threonine protein kinase
MLSAGNILNNRFALRKPLQSHSVRQTWLAKDLMFEDEVVVKLLELGGSMQWDDFKLLEREAQVLKQLNYPGLVQYRDDFALQAVNPWFCLVTKYVPGISLKEKLEKRYRFNQQELEWIAIEILNILDDLHQLNPPVIHRDIKPSNLIWGNDNHIHLIDFGGVQMQPRLPGATFTVVGTYGYTPIEQFGGQALPASDLYALGTTLVHLLTGIPPADLPQKQLRIDFKEAIRTQVEPAFIKWLEQLIEPTVEQRFQSAREALNQLKEISSNKILLPPESGVQIIKTPTQLKIEIPSRFSRQYLLPIRQLMTSGIFQIGKRLKSLPIRVKIQVTSAISIAVFLLYLLPLPWSEYSDNLLNSLITLPLLLLIIGVPAGLVFLILLLNSEIDYFGQASLLFDQEKFDIRWRQFGFPRRKTGEISQIQQFNLIKTADTRGNLNPSLEIAINKQLLFFLSQRQTYHVGHQLNEQELLGLKQEILDWFSELNSIDSQKEE